MNRSTVLPCSVRCPAVCFISPGFGSSRIASLPDLGFQRARAEITSWDGYEITPLRDLRALAQRAGLGAIRLKDEATRFCLGQLQGDWRCVRRGMRAGHRTGAARPSVGGTVSPTTATAM